MGRCVVEIEVIFLDILAMVALVVGQPEGPLFQDRVLPVPERESEAEALLIIGKACQAVFSPLVYPRPRLVMCEIVPGVAVVAVVLAHSPPLSFAEIRPPLLPLCLACSRLLQTDRFTVCP